MKKKHTLKAEKVLVRIRRCDKEAVQEELSDILSTSKTLSDQSIFFSFRLLLKRDKLQRCAIYTASLHLCSFKTYCNNYTD